MSEEDKPKILVLTIPETNATAEIELLWNVAPKTCEAIVKQLPLESICVHGRNSGDEALMPLPVLLKGIPQDSTENSTTEYKKGYVVFGISADNISQQNRFSEKYSFQYLLIADNEKDLINAFGVWGPKKFQGREYEGIHRTTFLIDENGIITRVINKVKTKDHATQILEEV